MKLIYADSDLHIPYEGDKNNYNFCISRERQIEVAILEYAKPKNHDKLFEISENPENLKGSTEIFLRTTIDFYNRVDHNSLKIINNRSIKHRIEFWLSNMPKDFRKDFLKRNIITTTLGDFLENEKLRKMFENDKGQIFCKTVVKEHGFANCAPFDDMYEEIGYCSARCGDDKMVMISEPLDVAQEYRTFVWDNCPICTSTYDDYNMIRVPDNVQEFINHSVSMVAKRMEFPTFYVIDVAETDRGLVIVEFNDFGLSGRYIGNDFCHMIDAMFNIKVTKPYAEFVKEFDEKHIRG